MLMSAVWLCPPAAAIGSNHPLFSTLSTQISTLLLLIQLHPPGYCKSLTYYSASLPLTLSSTSFEMRYSRNDLHKSRECWMRYVWHYEWLYSYRAVQIYLYCFTSYSIVFSSFTLLYTSSNFVLLAILVFREQGEQCKNPNISTKLCTSSCMRAAESRIDVILGRTNPSSFISMHIGLQSLVPSTNRFILTEPSSSLRPILVKWNSSLPFLSPTLNGWSLA